MHRPRRYRFAVRVLAKVALGASFWFAMGCHGEGSPLPPPAASDAAPTAAVDPAGAAGARPNRNAIDYARREAERKVAAEALAGGTYQGALLGAMRMQTSVMRDPSWGDDGDAGAAGAAASSTESAHRLGYVRHGARVPVLETPIVNEHCLEGWYELVQGGFICGRYATLDLRNPRVRLAPHPPDLASPLPYAYAYNLTNGTPLYRRVLSLEDRKKYEPWLTPAPPTPAPAKASDDEADPPVDDAVVVDAGALPVAPAPAPAPVPAADPLDAGPWYMRSYDGGKPQVTLDEMRGHGVLVRRMVRGFYLALDKEFHAAHAHWWRTTSGFAVPFERVALQPPLTDFHGTWLREETTAGAPALADAGQADAEVSASTEAAVAMPDAAEAPADAGADGAVDGGAVLPEIAPGTPAFFTSTYAQKYSVDAVKRRVLGGTGAVPRRTVVALTGVTTRGWSGSGFTGGNALAATRDGYWVRLADAYVPPAPTLPPGLLPDEKWIDVDLTHQTLVAYEAERPAYGTFVSSGRRNPTDPDKDHPTPVGSYRIREKHVTATMDGDVAADGPYSIEDVPWVMYFQGSYALHGAFWHGNFGHPMSHGCVNLSPADARALFGWVEPRLPIGWHGAYASADRPGTRVVIHE